MARPVPQCPLRPGEPCSLCQLYVTGPQDCGLVYLVMGDEELRSDLARRRREQGGSHSVEEAGGTTTAVEQDPPGSGVEEWPDPGADPRLEGLD